MNEYRVTIEYIDGVKDSLWMTAHSEAMAALIVGAFIGEELAPDLQRTVKNVFVTIETN